MTNKGYGNVCVLLWLASILSLAILGCAKKVPGPSEPQPGAELQGKWVGYEVDGRAGDWTFVISENRVDVNGPDEEWYKGTLSLDNQTTPMQANLVITDCSEPDGVGKTALGIYKLEANTLKLAASVPGETTRPGSFETGEDARVWLLTKQ